MRTSTRILTRLLVTWSLIGQPTWSAQRATFFGQNVAVAASGAAWTGVKANSPNNWTQAATNRFDLSISPTAGNTVAITFTYRSDAVSITSVKTTGAGSTCTVGYSVTYGGNAGHAGYQCLSVPSGVTTIEIQFSASGANPAATAAEYTVVTTFDVGTNDSNRDVSPLTGPSISPTTTNSTVIWCGAQNNAVAPVIGGTGFTDRGPSGSSNNDGRFVSGGERIVTSTSAVQTTVTFASDVANANCMAIR